MPGSYKHSCFLKAPLLLAKCILEYYCYLGWWKLLEDQVPCCSTLRINCQLKGGKRSYMDLRVDENSPRILLDLPWWFHYQILVSTTFDKTKWVNRGKPCLDLQFASVSECGSRHLPQWFFVWKSCSKWSWCRILRFLERNVWILYRPPAWPW